MPRMDRHVVRPSSLRGGKGEAEVGAQLGACLQDVVTDWRGRWEMILKHCMSRGKRWPTNMIPIRQ